MSLKIPPSFFLVVVVVVVVVGEWAHVLLATVNPR